MRFFGLRPGVVHVACAVALTSFSARADTLIVPSFSFPTIQSAIIAADETNVPPDVVLVSPGIYIENIDFLGKAITVRSTNPHDPAIVHTTIIDGSGAPPPLGRLPSPATAARVRTRNSLAS